MNPDTERLAERVRGVIGDDPNTSERKMFGGVCFMLNGNMLCGASGTGNLMLRVGKDQEAEARAKPNVIDMNFTGRPMRGYVYVEPKGMETDGQIAEWIAFAANFVGSLPANRNR